MSFTFDKSKLSCFLSLVDQCVVFTLNFSWFYCSIIEIIFIFINLTYQLHCLFFPCFLRLCGATPQIFFISALWPPLIVIHIILSVLISINKLNSLIDLFALMCFDWILMHVYKWIFMPKFVLCFWYKYILQKNTFIWFNLHFKDLYMLF